MKVSVPSRGILFPNEMQVKINREVLSKFPSPLGASYFQIRIFSKQWQFIDAFTGFRPLSGHLISKSEFDIDDGFRLRFRPLSGHLISKFEYKLSGELSTEFPSPLGASYFQI